MRTDSRSRWEVILRAQVVTLDRAERCGRQPCRSTPALRRDQTSTSTPRLHLLPDQWLPRGGLTHTHPVPLPRQGAPHRRIQSRRCPPEAGISQGSDRCTHPTITCISPPLPPFQPVCSPLFQPITPPHPLSIPAHSNHVAVMPPAVSHDCLVCWVRSAPSGAPTSTQLDPSVWAVPVPGPTCL